MLTPPTDLRLFIAIELSPELRTAVDQAAAGLRAAVTERLKSGGHRGSVVKWVAAENLHLTLKFLGETPRHVAPYVEAALAEAAPAGRPFRVRVGGSGAFPSTGKPRVLWLGVEVEERPLKALLRALDDALAPHGFPRETRPFSAHLTVARVREGTPPDEVRLIGEAVQRHRVGALGEQTVTSFALMRSELFRTGPVYTRLVEYPFDGPPIPAEPETAGGAADAAMPQSDIVETAITADRPASAEAEMRSARAGSEGQA